MKNAVAFPEDDEPDELPERAEGMSGSLKGGRIRTIVPGLVVVIG